MTPVMVANYSKTIIKWSAIAAAGPITGPLLAGVIRNFRSAPILAGLYAVAWGLIYLDLLMIAGHSARKFIG